MTFLSLAREADAAGDVLEAVRAYEIAIQREGIGREDLLNLAAIYEALADFGVASALKVPEALEGRAVTRALEVLEIAEGEYGPDPEVLFWRDYVGWSALGDEMEVARCRELARSGGAASDAMFGVFMLEARGWTPEFEPLLKRVIEGRTERERTIREALLGAKERYPGRERVHEDY